MIEKALKIAVDAHSGQIDKGGMPYILHPIRVMMMGKNENEMICGVLHDVVEDSNVTLDDLRAEGFSNDILDALNLLTKHKGIDYDSYINGIVSNNLAARVKLNDIRDNMDVSRLQVIDDFAVKRIIKYKSAYHTIMKSL